MIIVILFIIFIIYYQTLNKNLFRTRKATIVPVFQRVEEECNKALTYSSISVKGE
jgi:RNAse (barnase) inhibitor barstar